MRSEVVGKGSAFASFMCPSASYILYILSWYSHNPALTRQRGSQEGRLVETWHRCTHLREGQVGCQQQGGCAGVPHLALDEEGVLPQLVGVHHSLIHVLHPALRPAWRLCFSSLFKVLSYKAHIKASFCAGTGEVLLQGNGRSDPHRCPFKENGV